MRLWHTITRAVWDALGHNCRYCGGPNTLNGGVPMCLACAFAQRHHQARHEIYQRRARAAWQATISDLRDAHSEIAHLKSICRALEERALNAEAALATAPQPTPQERKPSPKERQRERTLREARAALLASTMQQQRSHQSPKGVHHG